MQNVKCRMQNNGIGIRLYIFIISAGNTIILYFAFSILHSGTARQIPIVVIGFNKQTTKYS